MIKFMRNEEGSVLVNIITALSITAILTVGIVVAIFYVNSLLDDNLEPVEAINNAHASKMDRSPAKEISDSDYKYLAQNGKAKLLGLSDKNLENIKDSKVVIPEEIIYEDEVYKVTEIGEGAFNDRLKEYGIKEVEIPKTVENIGLEAFKDNDLEKVLIPASVKTIGRGAFQNNKLKKVDLPKDLFALSDNAFKGNSLDTISIPEKVEEIGESSFADNKLKSVDLGKSVKIIKKDSFANNLLSEINIPESVKDVGQGSFRNNKIMKVSLSDGVKLDDQAIDGRFGDAYFFSLEEKGTYIREDEFLYSWKMLG